MTETVNHTPPEPVPEVFSEEEDPMFDSHVNWGIGDRLLILMSLVVTKRLLAFTPKVPVRIKLRMMERIDHLIERYRQPRERSW